MLKKRFLIFLFVSSSYWSFCQDIHLTSEQENALSEYMTGYRTLDEALTFLQIKEIDQIGIYQYLKKRPTSFDTSSRHNASNIVEAVYTQAKNNNLEPARDRLWADIRYTLEPFCDLILQFKEPGHKVFVDIGCGSGQKLYTSLCLGFEKAIGLEYSSESVGYAQEYLSYFIEKGLIQVSQGDALKAEEAFYKQGDFLYMYSPMKDDDDMAEFFGRALRNMNDGAVLLEVRMIYGETLAKKSKLSFPPQGGGWLIVKKMDGKYYYKNDEQAEYWVELYSSK